MEEQKKPFVLVSPNGERRELTEWAATTVQQFLWFKEGGYWVESNTAQASQPEPAPIATEPEVRIPNEEAEVKPELKKKTKTDKANEQ